MPRYARVTRRQAEQVVAGLIPPPAPGTPLPPPADVKHRDGSDLPGCPHCHARAPRYRELSDGFLICPHCARSFRP
jgi:hypothetical protein